MLRDLRLSSFRALLSPVIQQSYVRSPFTSISKSAQRYKVVVGLEDFPKINKWDVAVGVGITGNCRSSCIERTIRTRSLL